jgi:diacylglycerol kinase family enzyme
MTDRALLLFNPASGSAASHSPERLAALLSEGGAAVELHEIGAAPEKTIDLIDDAITNKRANWIAVAGGDGTVEAVASAMVGSSSPLGIIPVGTYNNFARSAGIPSDPVEACRVITGGKIRPVDVGFVNGRPFFEVVGIGLDAALYPASEDIKSGAFARVWDLAREAWRQPRHHLTLELDRPFTAARGSARHAGGAHHGNRRLRLRALMLTVSNAPYYGMNFAVAPKARIDDGLLTVTAFKRYGKLDLLRHFFAIRAGRRAYTPRLVTLQVERLRITSDHRPPVHTDGTPLDEWPLEFSISRGALRLFQS